MLQEIVVLQGMWTSRCVASQVRRGWAGQFWLRAELEVAGRWGFRQQMVDGIDLR